MKKSYLMSLIIMCCCFLPWRLSAGSGRWRCFLPHRTLLSTGGFTGGHIFLCTVWGGILLCFFFRSLRRHPVAVFFLSAAICTILEYLTGYFLEVKWGTRWWDYSDHFMNLNGRVCLLGAVMFGLGGVALVCLLLPIYERVYLRMAKRWRLCLCLVLLAVFVADATYCAVRPNTGRGISSQV